ncbi:MAG: transcriptional regulator NrdR [bacterium]|nr:transcriptional regulator NrdR [bacterium]
MKCPYCRTDNDRVQDTRPTEEGFAIRRRRICLHCGKRFTTTERAVADVMRVVKKNSVREGFDPEKIRQGLERACWKRPVSDKKIDEMVASIEAQIYSNQYEGEIPTRDIGEIVMNQLADVDQVAYVRFASVYREFKDTDEFLSELTRYKQTQIP